MRLILLTLALLTACTSGQKRHPASDVPQGCGQGSEVEIEFPKGLNIPGDGADQLSQTMGVPTIAWRGKGVNGRPEGILCIISSEGGGALNYAPGTRVGADVLQGAKGTFFVEKRSAFQLSCENIDTADRVTLSELQELNESMREYIVMHTAACVSMR